MQPRRTLATLMLLLLPALAAAQTCGQVVTGTLRLGADLRCTGPGPALILTGTSARLELAGFRIDMGGSGANAVDIHYARQAQVEGPGVISGAGIAVSVFRSQDVDLYGFDVEGSDAGVMALDSFRVGVVNNRFRKVRDRAVFVGSSPGGAQLTAGAVVLSNRMDSVGNGIEICGQGTSDARIRHNTITRASGWGIILYDGASHAVVHNNSVASTGYQAAIEVRSGSQNAIFDNNVSGSRLGAGIAIISATGQTCAVNPAAAADRNVVSRNQIRGFARGVQVGHVDGAPAHHNNLQGNLFEGNAIDVLLDQDSYATDARGNDRGVRGAGGVVVSDNGSSSLY